MGISTLLAYASAAGLRTGLTQAVGKKPVSWLITIIKKDVSFQSGCHELITLSCLA